MKEFLARQFWRPRLMCIYGRGLVGNIFRTMIRLSIYMPYYSKEGNGIQRIEGIELWTTGTLWQRGARGRSGSGVGPVSRRIFDAMRIADSEHENAGS
jgi:hypothetical protein